MLPYRPWLVASLLSVAMVCTGCGGGVTEPTPPAPVTISLTPTAASVFFGGTQQFTATVSNTTNTAVSWQVNGIDGGDASVGTISSTGLYTAPRRLPTPATVTIRAISQADPSKSASATVTIQSDVAVSITPATAAVELGASAQFNAGVSGSGDPDRTVRWSVNGIEGGDTNTGTIDATGLYTAPRRLPAGPVTVTATSLADPNKSASAAVTITSNLTVAITSGPSSVQNGATAQYTATVTPAPGSNPDPGVVWSVNGIAGGNATVGTVDANGLYTAPVVAPQPPQVTITATSVADPSKSASISVTIQTQVFVSVSPQTASVELEKSLQFSATVGGTTNQRVIWSVNGIIGGDLTVGTITNTSTNPGLYTAPAALPATNPVTVRATSEFDPSLFAEAQVTLFSNISVVISPPSATRAVGRKQTFSVQLSNTTNLAVEWRVNGIPGGNSTVGQICIAGLPGCQPTSSGSTVEYLAPAAVPATNPVTVEAVSLADPERRGSAVVTVLASVIVQVSPSSVLVPTGGTQQFTATVVGTDDQRVRWSVAGTACGGGPCGTITAGGLYTAPASAPAGASDTVIATSEEDPSRSGSAQVTLGNSPFVRTLEPSSLTAGVASSIPLRVLGSNFVTGSSGSGSAILFAGTPKATSCVATGSEIACTATLEPAELAAAGERRVEVRNPDGTTSNAVTLVVVEPPASEAVIRLDSATPTATRDIAVVDASTLGAQQPQVSVDTIGLLVNNTCTPSGNALRIERPVAGTREVIVCLFGPGLSSSHRYLLSGPSPNDILIGPVTGSGNLVMVTLTLSSTTRPGLRTLFVETGNRDRTAASGAIEVH
jgi:hypothetical protein